METAVATPARLPADAAVAFPLRDVDDLHDADLDAVLTDRLIDAGLAAASAGELVDLVGCSGPAAISAHTVGARALRLAVR
jgi:predicted component of type VI protein secretion system